jgi:cupin 2 domain-containing protein
MDGPIDLLNTDGHNGPAECIQTLLEGGSFRIERIVSSGQASPEGFWYDQDEHEWVMVLSGSAGLQMEGRDDLLTLRAGQAVNIPAHCRHRVAWTSDEEPTVWLAIHYLQDA